jgi:hypothetical protein
LQVLSKVAGVVVPEATSLRLAAVRDTSATFRELIQASKNAQLEKQAAVAGGEEDERAHKACEPSRAPVVDIRRLVEEDGMVRV